MIATEECPNRALCTVFYAGTLLALAAFFLLMAPFAGIANPQPALVSAAEVTSCEGGDPVFARKAEALIVAKIADQRLKFAPDAEALQPDPQLARIAQHRSCDMAHGADFSHTDAKGHFIAGEMVHRILSPYHRVAENFTTLSVITLETGAAQPFGPEEFASAAVNAWMNSPEHRANILNPNYRASGVGVVLVNGQAIATQVFGGF